MRINYSSAHPLANALSLLILSLVSFLFSCQKDSDDTTADNHVVANGITYPDSVFFGKNILSYADSTVLQNGAWYELGAVLEADAHLTIVMTNYPEMDSTSRHITEWYYNSQTQWVVGDYNGFTNTQQFASVSTGKISAEITFNSYGLTGHCKVEVYENGQSLTFAKHFFWQ